MFAGAGGVTLVAIAPKIATPTALPAERANTLTPVTTPRSLQSTDDCAEISAGAAIQPSPNPVTKDAAATVHGFGQGPDAASLTVPSSATTLPHSTVVR